MRARSFKLSPPEEQFAAEIRRRLSDGRGGARLPGIAALTRDFGVSRKTVERAFLLLERTGELKKGGGRGERVPGRTRGAPRGGTLVAYGLHPELYGSESLDVLRAAAETMPEPVTFLRLESGASREATVERILLSDAGSILLMHQPWGTGAALAAAGRRVVVLGSDGPDSPVPIVAMRFESLIREAFRFAFEASHTRVCYPLWRRRPEIAATMRGWIADEYRRAGLRHSPDFDAPVVDDDSPAAMAACIRSLFRHTPPGALVLQNLPQWLATVQTLSDLRVRVPADVSIVLLSHVRELAASPLAYAHLRYPVPELVSEFRKLMRRLDAGKPGGRTMLEPIREPGASLAPPRGPGR